MWKQNTGENRMWRRGGMMGWRGTYNSPGKLKAGRRRGERATNNDFLLDWRRRRPGILICANAPPPTPPASGWVVGGGDDTCHYPAQYVFISLLLALPRARAIREICICVFFPRAAAAAAVPVRLGRRRLRSGAYECGCFWGCEIRQKKQMKINRSG